MKRTLARKGLFTSIAAAIAIYVLREQLGDVARRAVAAMQGDCYWSCWSQTAENFFVDRWALTLATLAVTYFAYCYAAAPRE